MEKRYSKAMSDPTSHSQCETFEMVYHDDPKPSEKSFGCFECCIIKQTVDMKERSKIVNLNHPSLPKKMKFSESQSRCGHPVLKMFIASDSEDSLSYFLEKQPTCEKRIQFYRQIAEGIKYLNKESLVLCYLSPMHIHVVDAANGGKQCVIVHLGRVTRLVKRKDESKVDVIVRPFPNKWPRNAARWSPLECNESGCFSTPSDVAMLALTIFQLESAIGRGKDVPIKDTVPYSFIAKEDLIEAQHCMYNPLQAASTPNWLHRLVVASIANEPFMRPTIQQFIECLDNRSFPWPKKAEPLQVTNLRKRVSSVLEEDASYIMAGDVPLADRGSTDHQQKVKRKTMAVHQQDERPKKGFMAVLRNKFRRSGENQQEEVPNTSARIQVNQIRESMPVYQAPGDYLHMIPGSQSSDSYFTNDSFEEHAQNQAHRHGDGMNDYFEEHAQSQAHRHSDDFVAQPQTSCAPDTPERGRETPGDSFPPPQAHQPTGPPEQMNITHTHHASQMHANNDLYRLEGSSSQILPLASNSPINPSVEIQNYRLEEPTMQYQVPKPDNIQWYANMPAFIQQKFDNIPQEGQQTSSPQRFLPETQSPEHTLYHTQSQEFSGSKIPTPPSAMLQATTAATHASKLTPATEMNQVRSKPDKATHPPPPVPRNKPRKRDTPSFLVPVPEVNGEQVKSRLNKPTRPPPPAPEDKPGKGDNTPSPAKPNTSLQQVKSKPKKPTCPPPPVPQNKPGKVDNTPDSTVPNACVEQVKSKPEKPKKSTYPPPPVPQTKPGGNSASSPPPQVPNTPRPNKAAHGNTRQAVSFAPGNHLVSSMDITKTNSMPQIESPTSGDSEEHCMTWPKPIQIDHHARKLYTPTQKKKAERQTAVMATTLHHIHRSSGYESIKEQPVLGLRRATDNRGRIRQSQAYCENGPDYEEIDDDKL